MSPNSCRPNKLLLVVFTQYSGKNLIFVFVKPLAVILIIFLSLFLSGRGISAADYLPEETSAVITANKSGTINAYSRATPGREMCLAAVGGNAFSGNATCQGSSIRPTQTGRRVNPTTKTTFRLIKAGKVLEIRGTTHQGTPLFQSHPDKFLFNQYLHLMGILRL